MAAPLGLRSAQSFFSSFTGESTPLIPIYAVAFLWSVGVHSSVFFLSLAAFLILFVGFRLFLFALEALLAVYPPLIVLLGDGLGAYIYLLLGGLLIRILSPPSVGTQLGRCVVGLYDPGTFYDTVGLPPVLSPSYMLRPLWSARPHE